MVRGRKGAHSCSTHVAWTLANKITCHQLEGGSGHQPGCAKRGYNDAKTRRTRRAPPIHWQRLGPAGALNRDDEARVRGAERERDRENDCLPQGAVLPKQWRRCHDSGSALPITRAGGRLVPCRRHGGIMRKRADQRGQEDSGPGIGSAHDNVHARAHPNAHVPGG